MSTKMVSDPNSSSSTSDEFHPAFMVNNIKIAIPLVLDYAKVQYYSWVELFETHLCAYDLLDHIDSTVPRPPDVSASLWKRLDALVKQWICATISRDILAKILCRKSTAQQIWNRLLEIYQEGKKPSNIVYLGPAAAAAAAVNATAAAAPSSAGNGGNLRLLDQRNTARGQCVLKRPQQQQQRQQDHNNKKRESSNTGNVKEGCDESANMDFISTLPDNILVYLLSFLDLITANKTCILSTRWRYVWTYLTHLNFVHDPDINVFDTWVNQTIVSNRAPHLDSFRIHAPHKKFWSVDVERWFLFALSKSVRNLELNLLGYNNEHLCCTDIVDKYPKLLGANVVNTTLECLHLECVYTDESLLKWILSNCHNLQRLSIDLCEYKRHGGKEQVVVSSEKLKHLEFYQCRKDCSKQVRYADWSRSFETLHISAPNLTSFVLFENYPQPRRIYKDRNLFNVYTDRYLFDVEFASVPSLADASFGGLYSALILRDMDILSGLFSQLEKLSLLWDEVLSSTTVFPTFENVKHLEIAIRYDYGDMSETNLLSSIFLIRECPLLHTLKLKVEDKQPRAVGKIKKRQASAVLRPHEHLKVVEFAGFDGCKVSVEVSHCLLQYAPMLEKFIFDLRPACSESQRKSDFIRHPDEEKLDKASKMAKARSAIQSMLKATSREGLDVVIIEE